MRAPKRRSIAIFVVIGVLLLLIFLDTRGFLGGLTTMGYRALSPVLVLVKTASNSIAELVMLPFSYSVLIEERERLVEENNALREKIVGLRETERENLLLHDALNIQKLEGHTLQLANILYKDAIVPGDYFFVDAGEANGIAKGMPAISSSSVLVGVVAEAGDDFSRIRLITDPASTISARSQSSRILGTLLGEFGTSASFYLERRDEVPEEGEILITSGFDKGIPQGLILGEIRDVRETRDKTDTQASVSLLFEVSRIEEVFIITSSL